MIKSTNMKRNCKTRATFVVALCQSLQTAENKPGCQQMKMQGDSLALAGPYTRRRVMHPLRQKRMRERRIMSNQEPLELPSGVDQHQEAELDQRLQMPPSSQQSGYQNERSDAGDSDRFWIDGKTVMKQRRTKHRTNGGPGLPRISSTRYDRGEQQKKTLSAKGNYENHRGVLQGQHRRGTVDMQRKRRNVDQTLDHWKNDLADEELREGANDMMNRQQQLLEPASDSDYDTQTGLTESRIPMEDRIQSVVAKYKMDAIKSRRGNYTQDDKAQLQNLMVTQNPGIEIPQTKNPNDLQVLQEVMNDYKQRALDSQKVREMVNDREQRRKCNQYTGRELAQKIAYLENTQKQGFLEKDELEQEIQKLTGKRSSRSAVIGKGRKDLGSFKEELTSDSDIEQALRWDEQIQKQQPGYFNHLQRKRNKQFDLERLDQEFGHSHNRQPQIEQVEVSRPAYMPPSLRRRQESARKNASNSASGRFAKPTPTQTGQQQMGRMQTNYRKPTPSKPQGSHNKYNKYKASSAPHAQGQPQQNGPQAHRNWGNGNGRAQSPRNNDRGDRRKVYQQKEHHQKQRWGGHGQQQQRWGGHRQNQGYNTMNTQPQQQYQHHTQPNHAPQFHAGHGQPQHQQGWRNLRRQPNQRC